MPARAWPQPQQRRERRGGQSSWSMTAARTGRPAEFESDGLSVQRRSVNGGKGAAVLDGAREADRAGFTHILVMDADGQHAAEPIPRFMAASLARPEAMILGQPEFGAEAPWARVHGRRISNALVAFLTADAVGDSLFGFRVYPIRPLLEVMDGRPAGCVVSILTRKRPSVLPGEACRRSSCRSRCAISGRRRAGCHISATGGIMSCWRGCIFV